MDGMSTNPTREIDTYTEDGPRWPIYEYVDPATGEVTYRAPAGPLVKKLSETEFQYPGARKRVVRTKAPL